MKPFLVKKEPAFVHVVEVAKEMNAERYARAALLEALMAHTWPETQEQRIARERRSAEMMHRLDRENPHLFERIKKR